MMLRAITLALPLGIYLTMGGAVRADVEPADTVPADMVPGIAACMETAEDADVALACLEREGVSEAARALASSLRVDSALGLPGILVEVVEAGPVDLALVILPALSTEEVHAVFVNGLREAAIALELAFSPSPPETPGTRALRAAHPDAEETSRVSVLAHRVLPGGAQRFVLADRVADGCATCAEVGVALTYLDFMRGALVGVDRLGWFAPVPPPETIADRLEASDILVLQARLNALGYDAGPVDGVVGRRTRAAFYSFKRDHCLPENPRLRPVIPILAASEPDLTPPPCAPEVFSRTRDATEPMLTSP